MGIVNVEMVSKTVRAFRLGMEGEANDSLVKLIDQITSIITQLPAEVTPKVNLLLEEVFNAVSRKDYLWAADLLEYELYEYIIE